MRTYAPAAAVRQERARSAHVGRSSEYHYGKHHQTYVTNLNKLVHGHRIREPVARRDREEVESGGVFNNSAQIWNHTFFWNSLSPSGGGAPSGALAMRSTPSGGSYDKFEEEFTKVAVGTFGSGWAWLVKKADGTLDIVSTSNARHAASTTDSKALLTLDVWEHAYYIDYPQRASEVHRGLLEYRELAIRREEFRRVRFSAA